MKAAEWKLRQDSLLSADGCYKHDHCLTCPLAVCIYDEPENYGVNGEIARLRSQGMSLREIAALVGVSAATVTNRLKKVAPKWR